MGLCILAAVEEVGWRGVAAEVVAHAGDFSVGGAAGMKTVDDVGQVLALIRARGWVGSAVDHQHRSVDSFPLACQADVADLLHVRSRHAGVTLNHVLALLAEFCDFLSGLM